MLKGLLTLFKNRCTLCKTPTKNKGHNPICNKCAKVVEVATEHFSISPYVELVREWTRQAQSSCNTADERAIYERCACALHETNAQDKI